MEGLERIPQTGPAIVAGNHLSYLDPFAHGYFVVRAGRRPRFLAKQELFDAKGIGTVLRGAHQISVARGTGDQSPLVDAAAAVRAGEVVVVYPEGTTTTTNQDFSPGPGKTGTVRLSLASGVPILPVATWGGQYVWRKSGRQSLAFGRPIWVTAGEPFDPAFHEALLEVEPPKGTRPGAVVQEVQKGYARDNRALRAARVVVARSDR